MSVRSSPTISRKVLARDAFDKHSGLDYDVTVKIARHKMAALREIQTSIFNKQDQKSSETAECTFPVDTAPDTFFGLLFLQHSLLITVVLSVKFNVSVESCTCVE